ncbi:hypothetical protein WISP_40751 [Willisornis vidua]|uniref:Uncharacterized protein n=1 Tax=Willisornis vidua TaxID=1566151 RepID=A0ABQ9DIC7_9PASS|nr:hypothetical protein WISP_40751 [Willisornis vidua]
MSLGDPQMCPSSASSRPLNFFFFFFIISPSLPELRGPELETVLQAGVTSIEAMLMRMQLRWAGHISRMEDHRLPKIVLYGDLTTGCLKRGAPKRRYKDSLKQHLSPVHIDCPNGPLWPPTGIHGDTLFTMLLPPLKMHAESVSR